MNEQKAETLPCAAPRKTPCPSFPGLFTGTVDTIATGELKVYQKWNGGKNMRRHVTRLVCIHRLDAVSCLPHVHKTFCKQAANMGNGGLYMEKQVAFHCWRNSRRIWNMRCTYCRSFIQRVPSVLASCIDFHRRIVLFAENTGEIKIQRQLLAYLWGVRRRKTDRGPMWFQLTLMEKLNGEIDEQSWLILRVSRRRRIG